MRKLIIVIVVVVILGGSFLLAMFLMSQKQEPPRKPSEETVRAVNAEKIVYEKITTMVELTGRLGSHHYVDVITEVSGEILQGDVNLKKGQDFKKGDLLFRIFDEEAMYGLKASKSRFLNLIANVLPDLKIDFPDNYKSWKSFFNNIEIDKPLPDLPDFISDKEKTFIASKNILNDYYTILSSEVRLSKYIIHAPFEGTFSEVYLEVGSVANPGSRVARIIRTDKLELEVPVEVEDIKWLAEGDQVDIYAEDTDDHWKGFITRKSGFVDPQTQSVSVFITVIPDSESPLFEGQYLRAVFTGKVIESAMRLPRNAVFNFDEVFIVKNNELFKEQIQIHKVSDNSIVFSGLPEGTHVVTEPLINIPERTRVEIINN